MGAAEKPAALQGRQRSDQGADVTLRRSPVRR
jgi:hypothetical protein